MLFSSVIFLYVFLPLLLLAYYLFPGALWRRNVLIIFSLFFYAWGEPLYVFLLIGCVAADYGFGLLIGYFNQKERPRAKKITLVAAVCANLGILALYKYAGFLFEQLNLLGLGLPALQLSLPLGISFFTFQAMSYIVDVYRGDAPAQRSFPRLLLYVSLFPQLIAGPIVRYKDIDDQLESRSVSLADINDGAFRFAVGLAKKVLLANACGSAADMLLAVKLGEASVSGAWFGGIFYALQIYYDFAGYSDMAIGLGHIFGFTFLENFNYPYISRSATEFWRRWHISLGSFFRDYLYIPLGGNRQHWLRNVLIVWLATGFWHGASWNFLFWGLYYGCLLILEKKWLLPAREKWPTLLQNAFSVIYMTAVTIVGWTLFYYTDNFLPRIGLLFGIGARGLGDLYDMAMIRDNILLCGVALLFCFPWPTLLAKKLAGESDGAYLATRIGKTLFILVSLALCTVMLAGSSYNPFLYFRF